MIKIILKIHYRLKVSHSKKIGVDWFDKFKPYLKYLNPFYFITLQLYNIIYND
jgi:hypothetical protein